MKIGLIFAFCLMAFSVALGQAHKSVVCLGDSVTAQYAPILSQMLAPRFYFVKTIAREEVEVSEEDIRQTVALHPDIILLGLGTDCAADRDWERNRDRFVPNMKLAIDRLRASASHPKVFICLPPPAALPESDARKSRLGFEVVPLLKQAARESECDIIDFDAALRDRLDLVTGLRINDLGAEILADTVADTILIVRKADWKVVYADSEEPDEGPAKNAIDGDPETYWHTNYSTTADKYPHEIQVDTGAVRTCGGFSYYPRQDGVNGRVAKYEFYVSLDGKNWGDPVAKGQFPPGGDLIKVSFAKPALCRYFRFRALSELQGQIWTSVGELDILKFYPKRP